MKTDLDSLATALYVKTDDLLKESPQLAPLDTTTLRLLRTQNGRCPLCGGLLLHADREPQSPHEWEQWIKVTRTAIRKHAITAETGNGTPDEPAAPRLLHASCRRRHTTGTGTDPAPLPAREALGLA